MLKFLSSGTHSYFIHQFTYAYLHNIYEMLACDYKFTTKMLNSQKFFLLIFLIWLHLGILLQKKKKQFKNSIWQTAPRI